MRDDRPGERVFSRKWNSSSLKLLDNGRVLNITVLRNVMLNGQAGRYLHFRGTSFMIGL
jgi:hypothetical protein